MPFLPKIQLGKGMGRRKNMPTEKEVAGAKTVFLENYARLKPHLEALDDNTVGTLARMMLDAAEQVRRRAST
jgi:hypothetical protein